jgi:type I restriction enzyme M protein
MQYVWEKYHLTTYRQKSHYAGKYLYGIDFDEKSAKISKAIMLIAGDGKTHIFNENTLDYKRRSDKALV